MPRPVAMPRASLALLQISVRFPKVRSPGLDGPTVSTSSVSEVFEGLSDRLIEQGSPTQPLSKTDPLRRNRNLLSGPRIGANGLVDAGLGRSASDPKSLMDTARQD